MTWRCASTLCSRDPPPVLAPVVVYYFDAVAPRRLVSMGSRLVGASHLVLCHSDMHISFFAEPRDGGAGGGD